MTESKDTDVKDKGLSLRVSTYYGCVVVPTDLRAEVGRTTIRESLFTSDLTEARLKLAQLRAEKLAEFAKMRRRLQPTTQEATPEVVQQVATEVRRWVLQADENGRAGPAFARALLAREERKRVLAELDRLLATQEGQALAAALPRVSLSSLTIASASRPSPAPAAPPKADPLAGRSEAEADALARLNAAIAADIGKANRLDNLGAAMPMAQAVAKDLGMAVDWTTPQGLKGLKSILAAYAQATAEVVQRDAGQVVQTPAPAVAPTKAPAVPLEDLRKVWEKADTDRRPDTLRKMQRACDLLAEFLKVPAVHMDKVTHAQADDFRSWLLGRGVAPKTAKMSLDFLKTLFALAKRRRTIPEDPFAELSIKASSAAVREGWPMSDLKKLFGAPLFTQYAIPRPGQSEAASKAGLDAAYWVPLLCLYTGARASEVCQLRAADVLAVESEEDHEAQVMMIDITEATADAEAGTKARRVKNVNSVRRVPVHSDLVALGFLDYVKAIKDSGAGQLFPAVTSREGAPAGEYFSTWFGVFKRSIGFGQWEDLHNMRHTLRTRLAIVGLQESAIDALAGHADGQRGSIGRQVYTHWKSNPQALAREQARLTFPGLDLPRVFKAPVWKP